MKIKRSFKLFIFLLFFVSLFSLISCKKDKNDNKVNPDGNNGNIVDSGENQGNGSYDFTDLTVRDYVGKNGVVAAANPYAAKAGLEILQAGGNAFDAAVAVSFALGVVEPNASGLGGGGILVAYEASTGEYVSYNFREFVPGAGTADAYPNGDADVDGGIKSSGVPTQVAGLLKVLENHGNKTRQEVMAPAIHYADNGVKVTPELASAINDNFSKIMVSRDETLDVFTYEGIEPLQKGDTLIQKDYAHTLKLISEKGAEGFYTGETAQAIVDCQEENGGLITLEDLEYAMNNYPKVSTPVMGTYRGYDIASANSPSSGGMILLEALNMIENYGDVSKLGHNSAEYLNVVGTAMALAYGDKRKYIADTAFVDVPVSGLLSKAYAAERWQKYTVGQAYLGRHQGDNDYGNPWDYIKEQAPVYYQGEHEYIEHYSTTSFSICDAEGNIVSVTQTINYFFGNGYVPQGTGFFLNNELSSFSFTPSSVHYIEPYKQPVSHIMPTIIMKDGSPWATLGSPGGLRIPSAVLQVVLNLIDFDMDIQSAIAAPRIYTYAAGSSDKSTTSKDLYIEYALYETVGNQLSSMKYNVIPYGAGDIDLYFGGVQGIRFNASDGTMHGGADPRRDGKALGY